ncbi:sorting nexin-15 [Rhinophrynus dorsalis]
MSRRVREQHERRYWVTDTRTHPKGFTEYKVTAEFISKKNPQDVKEIVVWKRYSDFKKLHGELLYTHRNLFQRAQEFPAFPRAQVFGRFEAPVIEERRQAAEDMLKFTVNIPALNNSPQLKDFFRGGEVVMRSVDLDSADAVVLPPPLTPEPVRCCSPNSLTPNDLALFDPCFTEGGAPVDSEADLHLLSLVDEGEELTPATHIAEDGDEYLSQATEEVQRAMERESAGDYPEAFRLYRNAVDALLRGVKDDPCTARRDAVARRTAEYLCHAEKIFKEHMSGGTE